MEFLLSMVCYICVFIYVKKEAQTDQACENQLKNRRLCCLSSIIIIYTNEKKFCADAEVNGFPLPFTETVYYNRN